jgi:hypothetical protein
VFFRDYFELPKKIFIRFNKSYSLSLLFELIDVRNFKEDCNEIKFYAIILRTLSIVIV